MLKINGLRIAWVDHHPSDADSVGITLMLVNPTTTFVVALILAGWLSELAANGINNNGAGGRALNGATTAQPTDAIDAMATNPAGLVDLDPSWNIGLIGIHADGHYSRRGSSVDLDNKFELAPEFALAFPLGDDLMIGLGVIPEQLRVVDWRYRDAPGGLSGNTSYGCRDHRAEFIGIRSSIGVGALERQAEFRCKCEDAL